MLWPAAQYALDLEVGMVYGRRMVADPKIRGVYGNGTVYDPFLAVRLWKGLAVGVDYEGGYSRTGKIGTYQEPTSLKVTGPEFFVRYELNLKFVSPFIKVGYGSYSYQQTIESPHIAGHVVDGTKSCPSFGGRAQVFPGEVPVPERRAQICAAQSQAIRGGGRPRRGEIPCGGGIQILFLTRENSRTQARGLRLDGSKARRIFPSEENLLASSLRSPSPCGRGTLPAQPLRRPSSPPSLSPLRRTSRCVARGAFFMSCLSRET